MGGYRHVHIGETLGGRYLVVHKLGWGHFSTVRPPRPTAGGESARVSPCLMRGGLTARPTLAVGGQVWLVLNTEDLTVAALKVRAPLRPIDALSSAMADDG